MTLDMGTRNGLVPVPGGAQEVPVESSSRGCRGQRERSTALVVARGGDSCPSARRRLRFRTIIPSRCFNTAYKPRGIVYACGDFAARVVRIDWDRWRHFKATGSGIDYFKDCVPIASCDHYAHIRSAITLFRPRYCRNVRRNSFTRLIINHTQPGPGRDPYKVPFPCSLLG